MASEDTQACKRRKVAELGGLNNDCLQIILNYLDYVDLVRVSRVNTQWYNISHYLLQRMTKIVMQDLFQPWKRMFHLSDRHFVDIFKRLESLSELDISVPGPYNGNAHSSRRTRSNSSRIMPQGLQKAMLTYCPDLKKLAACQHIWEMKPTLALFKRLPNLTHLKLNFSSLTDPILDTILGNCKLLISLDISCTEVTGECFKNHSPTAIKSLNIGSCAMMFDHFTMSEVLKNVHRLCPNLGKLQIWAESTGEFFEDVFRLYRNEDLLTMSSLKTLNMNEMQGRFEDEEE